MSPRAATVRLLAVTVITAVALTATPVPTAVAAPTAGEKRYQTKVFKVVNNKRANHDRVKLRKNKCLQRFANRHAQRMANKKRLFHQNEGRVIRRCGLRIYAENAAFNSGGPRAVVRAWMHSTGHRKNILWKRPRITGVGARKAGGYWWVAQVFGRK